MWCGGTEQQHAEGYKSMRLTARRPVRRGYPCAVVIYVVCRMVRIGQGCYSEGCYDGCRLLSLDVGGIYYVDHGGGVKVYIHTHAQSGWSVVMNRHAAFLIIYYHMSQTPRHDFMKLQLSLACARDPCRVLALSGQAGRGGPATWGLAVKS